VGALEAAADGGKLGIGVDSNQNGTCIPGKVLTSMLKRVDVAVYNCLHGRPGWQVRPAASTMLGVAEGGIDYAMDDNNAPLITPEMKTAVEKAKADIIAGTIQVHDYRTDNKCPY
jgi:basic membrane protein A